MREALRVWALLSESMWVWMSALWHTGAAGTLRGAGGGAGTPAKWLQVRQGTEEGSGPLSAQRRSSSSCSGPLCKTLQLGPPPMFFLSCGLRCRKGLRLGQRGGRGPLAATAPLWLWEQRPRCLPPPPPRAQGPGPGR